MPAKDGRSCRLFLIGKLSKLGTSNFGHKSGRTFSFICDKNKDTMEGIIPCRLFLLFGQWKQKERMETVWGKSGGIVCFVLFFCLFLYYCYHFLK